MKKQILRHLLKPLFVTVLVSTSYYSFTNGGGAPAGNTNAPGDASCAQSSCHGGSVITSGTNWNNFTITTNIPANGYVPGTSYTVTISHAVAGINKWGFQFVALNASTFSQAGSLTAGTGMQSTLSGGKTYLTHNSAGTAGTGSKSWSFTWTAPNPGVGQVSFYATVNAANGDNGSGGDQIYGKSITVAEFSNLPTAVIGGVPPSGNVCLGDTLNLQGSGLNTPTSYAWTFTGISNPTLQAQQNPRVVFTGIGLKTITLRTTNSFGSSSISTVLVNVVNKPSATVSPSGAVNICGTDSVTLNATFNSLFTYVWSPGNETTPSIKTATPGVYRVKVTNTTTGCFANSANITLTAQSKPVAVLSVSKDSICSQDSLTLSANTPFTSYVFLDNSTVVSSGTAPSFTAKFPSGLRNIGLVVTGSGCNSDTVRKVVYVQPILPSPNLTCGAKTTSSVSFSWSAVVGASGYEVSVDTGKTWIVPSGSQTHTVTGLTPGSNAQVWVRAIDAALCSRGNIATLVCTNGSCSPITYTIQIPPSVCLKSTADSAIVPVTLSNISAPNVGISFNGESYTKNLTYSAKVVSGINSISIKIVDSSNIGCPRVDTIIRIEGIHPISKRPILGVRGALCTGDSAVHVLEVYNANSGADLFQLYRNADVTAFGAVNSNGSDTVRFSIPRPLSPLQDGDALKVIAVDAQTGCDLVSLPYTAAVYQSPKAGYTTEVNSLTITLTDTTFRTAKRDWRFAGAITDEINGARSITKTFPTSGTKQVSMIVTDSNGCVERASSSVVLFNVGLQESDPTQALAVYPNPASSELTIDFKGEEGPIDALIMDAQGQLIKKVEWKEAERKLDIQTLTPGLYLLHLTQANNHYFIKFMKK